eukprot:Rhum_TRINITY_DN15076_c3_g1::Rhum_TRINITY_DN15076_c3_g1_i1::g.136733::m.136733
MGAERRCDELEHRLLVEAKAGAELREVREENTLLHGKLRSITEMYNKTLASLNSLQAHHDQEEVVMQGTIDEHEDRLKAAAREVEEANQQRRTEVEALRTASEQQCALLKARVAELEQECARATASLANADARDAKSARRADEAVADAKSAQQKARAAEQDAAAARADAAAAARGAAASAHEQERGEEKAREAWGQLHALQAQAGSAAAELADLRRRCSQHDAAAAELRREAAAAREEVEKTRLSARQREVELSKMHRNEAAKQEAVLVERAAAFDALQRRHEEFQARFSAAAGAKEVIEGLADRYLAEKARRVRLYDQLVQAKGNIRVKCRLRPALTDQERADAADLAQGATASSLQVALKNGKKREFRFDGVLRGDATQEEAFEGSAGDLVQSVLDGYNVCIMAYGQTGSGKTHTMFGAGGAAAEGRGVIARSLERFFSLREAKVGGGGVEKVTVSVSMVEIYCGEVRDLLADLKGTGEEAEDGAASTRVKRYMMGSETVVHNMVDAGSLEECLRLLEHGRSVRAASSTQCNEQSSRSHCLYTLHYSCEEVVGEGAGRTGAAATTAACNVVNSRMVLVDLGGSECVTKAGIDGQQVRECSHINKSLSALADVLTSLSAGRAHVPYRNSKLTHILADCLGGDAKMLLYVTANPMSSQTAETLHSLAFGHKARQVRRGEAKQHITQKAAHTEQP